MGVAKTFSFCAVASQEFVSQRNVKVKTISGHTKPQKSKRTLFDISVSQNCWLKLLSQHVCEACGQLIPPTKDIAGPLTRTKRTKNSTDTKTIFMQANKLIILFTYN